MEILICKAISGYRMSNEAAGKSPVTTSWHNANLGYFLKWFESENGEDSTLSQITPIAIRTYLNELRNGKHRYESHPYRSASNRSVSPRTIQAYYSSLSAFFNWCIREELIIGSPLKNIPRPKIPKFLPDPFSEDEIRSLFSAAKRYEEAKSARLIAIMLMLLDTAVRLSELLNMKIEDVDIDQGRIKVMGKGSKERFVFFGRSTKRNLWRYINLYRSDPLPRISNLFLTQSGHPISSRRLAHYLTEVGKEANVENVHPHRWRRTAAIQFLRNSNGDVLALQKLLGHETLEMVRRYVNYTPDDVARAHKIASPVDNLGL